MAKLRNDADPNPRVGAWIAELYFAKDATERQNAIDMLVGLVGTTEFKDGDIFEALQAAGGEAAIPSIAKFLKTGTTRQRSDAINALAAIGSKEAIPYLEQLEADLKSESEAAKSDTKNEEGPAFLEDLDYAYMHKHLAEALWKLRKVH